MEGAAAVRQKLERLAGARSPRGVFLTVTLSTSRLDDWRQFAPTFLNSEFSRLLKELQPEKSLKHSLERDLEWIVDIIKHDVASPTQGLALFADGGPELFERIELPLPLLNRVVIEPSPHVRPVVHALALMEPFAIARVSRDESSLFVVDEWGVSSERDLTGPWLKTSDRETGERSIRRYFAAARQDSLVDQHFKEVGASLGTLLEVSGAGRVILCAQHDIASNFRHTLPQATATRIVAEIPLTLWPAQARCLVRLASPSKRLDIESWKAWLRASRTTSAAPAVGPGVSMTFSACCYGARCRPSLSIATTGPRAGVVATVIG